MAAAKSVLFVCLGNICRSPMAEAILKNLVKERSDTEDWLIESCATARYHIGEQPDDRCIETLEKHKIHKFRSTVRQLNKDDFTKFKWIFVFDEENKVNVLRVKPSSSDNNVVLIRMFDPEKDTSEKSPTVIDPYWYDDMHHFDLCFDQLKRSLQNFLHQHFKDEL